MRFKHVGTTILLVSSACSAATGRPSDETFTGATFGSGDAGDEGSGDSSGNTSGDTDGPNACLPGLACEGGLCIAGDCCPALQVCGTLCCGDGLVCSFGQCVEPGPPCESIEACDADEYCELALGDEDQPQNPGCFGGGGLSGQCLPQPPTCEGDDPLGPGGLPTCVETCDVDLEGGELDTTLAYEVEGPGYTAPIVMQLDDDDCDGRISARDIPEIIWNTHTGANYVDPTNGRIKAISIVEGQVEARFTYDAVLPMSQLAAGDVDGDPSNGNEIVACASDASVVALDGDGNVRWQAQVGTCGTPYPNDSLLLISVPNIADLDRDGVPEVITERAILDGASGAIEATYAANVSGTVAVSDVDADGWLDIVSGNKVFDRHGALIANVGISGLIWPAIADLDNDGFPEIVGTNFNNRSVAIWRITNGVPQVVRPALPLNAAPAPACPQASAGATHGGGAPTIGDFNGDGTPDLALAGGNAYIVFDGEAIMNPATPNDQTVLWWSPTSDCSSAQTGSTLFDFDGNGRTEVVYGDEQFLRIYDGLTGAVLAEHAHVTGTLNEYPVVADVDADGQADIVEISRGTCGDQACGPLRVYSSGTGNWVRTRRVWNQYTYHVTNVEEDGTIPPFELANWSAEGLNSFRQNKQPGGEFAAADATVELAPGCFDDYTLRATVRNLGQAPLPSGAVVSIYGDGELLGTLETTATLYPAQSQVLLLPLPGPPNVAGVHANVSSGVAECQSNNNTSAPVDPACVPIG